MLACSNASWHMFRMFAFGRTRIMTISQWWSVIAGAGSMIQCVVLTTLLSDAAAADQCPHWYLINMVLCDSLIGTFGICTISDAVVDHVEYTKPETVTLNSYYDLLLAPYCQFVTTWSLHYCGYQQTEIRDISGFITYFIVIYRIFSTRTLHFRAIR